MAYSAPEVTAAGLTMPSYDDIQQSLLDSYQAIYGSTTYLGNDSADFQWISAVALKLFDNQNLAQLVYNNRSPATAIGAGLDGVVKINGIMRLSPTYSTVTLLLTGTTGAVVSNAVIQDTNGVQWVLPTSVTIGPGTSVSSVATCSQAGAISAQPGTVNVPVGGFTSGWTSVTNPVAANVGTIPESDSDLRARQAISVSVPSSTRLAATTAGIESIADVTRVNVMENQTSVTDSYGNASHSITCVVEGGDPQTIANSIYNNKGIGANTLGGNPSASVILDTDGNPGINVTDPNTGNIMRIGFYRPTYVPIFVTLNIHPLTSNYNSTMQSNIVTALTNYLQGLKIGEIVTQSALYAVALSVMHDLLNPDFSIRGLFLGTAASPTSTTDIPLAFYQVAQGVSANITIVPV